MRPSDENIASGTFSFRLIRLLLRIVLGGVFLCAALPKVADPIDFFRAIQNYHLLPMTLSRVLALCLPWIELCVGLALLCGLNVRGSALVAAALLVTFIGAISSTVIRGLDIQCGCFGAHSSSVGLRSLLEDFLLLLVAAGVFGMGRPGRPIQLTLI